MFFFQAEDGIRDLVRSRGLGDVYKRQEQGGAKTFVAVPDDDTTRVLGFFALSPASAEYAPAPPVGRRGLGRPAPPALLPLLFFYSVDHDHRYSWGVLGGRLLNKKKTKNNCYTVTKRQQNNNKRQGLST